MKKNTNMKTFKLGKLFVGISVPSKKRSIWISRHKRNRMDHFLSFHRTYNRDRKVYTHTIIIYKLNIKWIWD